MAEIPTIQRVVAILWPSFLTAGLATILFFTAFDPQLLLLLSGHGEISRLGGYTIGFFLFWLLTAVTSALNFFFQAPCDRINRKASGAI
jgi:hypothetical protein